MWPWFLLPHPGWLAAIPLAAASGYWSRTISASVWRFLRDLFARNTGRHVRQRDTRDWAELAAAERRHAGLPQREVLRYQVARIGASQVAAIRVPPYAQLIGAT